MRITFFSVILISVLLLENAGACGQQYRLFDPGRIRTYGIDSTDYFFIRVDSTAQEGADSAFYFNRYIDTATMAECLPVDAVTPPVGPKMIQMNDAEQTRVFFNKYGDSIIIKLNRPVGYFWRLYEYPDGKHIRATVAPKMYFTVLPATFDSVYRLTLNVYDDAYIIQPDSIMNDARIEISKEYGLVAFKDFYNFPYDTNMILLKGIDNPDNAIVDLHAARVFDFEPGNEFHYLTEKLSGSIDPLYSLKKEKFFVLDKIQYADSVQYTMFHAAWESTNSGFDTADTIRTIDTVTVSYRYADYGFLEPMELSLLQGSNYGYSNFFKTDTLYWGRAYKEVYDWFDYDAVAHCLDNAENNYLPEWKFGDGIGIMHYRDSTDIMNYITTDLVWFQKGLEVWGEPFDFEALGVVEIHDVAIGTEIHLYPNPATDILRCRIPGISGLVSVVVTDVQGNAVIRQMMQSSPEMQVEISGLSNGIYLLRITGESITCAGTFIKN